MVYFRWQVTEDIRDYNFTFDPKTEEVEIHGEFQIDFNGIYFGYFGSYPKENLFKGFGREDIPMVFDSFINEVALLKDGETISLLFLQNVCFNDHTMTRKGDELFLRQYNRNTGEENCCIKCDFNEFVEETKRNIKLFIEYIKKENPSLLENESIIKLMKGIE